MAALTQSPFSKKLSEYSSATVRAQLMEVAQLVMWILEADDDEDGDEEINSSADEAARDDNVG